MKKYYGTVKFLSMILLTISITGMFILSMFNSTPDGKYTRASIRQPNGGVLKVSVVSYKILNNGMIEIYSDGKYTTNTFDMKNENYIVDTDSVMLFTE